MSDAPAAPDAAAAAVDTTHTALGAPAEAIAESPTGAKDAAPAVSDAAAADPASDASDTGAVATAPKAAGPLVDPQDGDSAERILHAAIHGHEAQRLTERLRGEFRSLPWETADETVRQRAVAHTQAIAGGMQNAPFVQRVVDHAVEAGHDVLAAAAGAAAFFRAALGHLVDSSPAGKAAHADVVAASVAAAGASTASENVG